MGHDKLTDAFFRGQSTDIQLLSQALEKLKDSLSGGNDEFLRNYLVQPMTDVNTNTEGAIPSIFREARIIFPTHRRIGHLIDEALENGYFKAYHFDPRNGYSTRQIPPMEVVEPFIHRFDLTGTQVTS